MPRLCAVMVIMSANLSSDPPIFSASAIAASLPEATIATSIAWRTVIVWPASRPNRTGGTEAARAETVSLSASESRPAPISVKAT